ncbi:hypothetical protein M5K25_014233 [Dendrobium thyrsiflorum]|uniref:Uncharacterized protein n=1 Tax=Dendrobium thyrsiflorum TaxID=117978 RepID=A0ABD0UVT3_DENTH
MERIATDCLFKMFMNKFKGFVTDEELEEGWDCVGGEESSRIRAERGSGLMPRSRRAMRSERVWRSSPVSSTFDIWNARSSVSFAFCPPTAFITTRRRLLLSEVALRSKMASVIFDLGGEVGSTVHII